MIDELEALYRQDFQRFLRAATAVIGSEDRAYDAVQDAFARAISHRRGFRREGDLAGWLWRIVVNAARAEASRAPLPALEREAGAESPPPTGVRDAIAGLPERQRLVLFLRYYADLDYRTIAEALEIRPGTVAATLNAAHTGLRRTLEEVS